MGPAAASAHPLMCAPYPVEVRPNMLIDQAQGRKPGQMFAFPQPDRRQLTYATADLVQ